MDAVPDEDANAAAPAPAAPAAPAAPPASSPFPRAASPAFMPFADEELLSPSSAALYANGGGGREGGGPDGPSAGGGGEEPADPPFVVFPDTCCWRIPLKAGVQVFNSFDMINTIYNFGRETQKVETYDALSAAVRLVNASGDAGLTVQKNTRAVYVAELIWSVILVVNACVGLVGVQKKERRNGVAAVRTGSSHHPASGGCGGRGGRGWRGGACDQNRLVMVRTYVIVFALSAAVELAYALSTVLYHLRWQAPLTELEIGFGFVWGSFLVLTPRGVPRAFSAGLSSLTMARCCPASCSSGSLPCTTFSSVGCRRAFAALCWYRTLKAYYDQEANGPERWLTRMARRVSRAVGLGDPPTAPGSDGGSGGVGGVGGAAESDARVIRRRLPFRRPWRHTPGSPAAAAEGGQQPDGTTPEVEMTVRRLPEQRTLVY
ncbi:MAG: hypothetical protein BJ554DRAFT_4284 [Olpidium bornovanus]|uniref:Uncharacterized protein n=1 Tax=Olpidium bornovanus TaxID=278681 RepID=A0A8H7ZMZ5_9FUNG|nr:MAG: hypothetical protein BJ554DRAFT_4284 [Olpidium bornovanus]